MPKTEITKPESEDVKELADEALDRTGYAQSCASGNWTGCSPPTE